MRRRQIPNVQQKLNEVVPKRTTKYVFPHKYFSSEPRQVIDNTEYVYQFPADWTNVDSVRKSIAFRTARNSKKYVQSFAFNVYFKYVLTFDGVAQDPIDDSLSVMIVVSENDTMAEIANAIVVDINDTLANGDYNNYIYCISQHTTQEDGSCTLSFVLYSLDNTVTVTDFKFELHDRIPNSEDNFMNFLKYFNQETTVTITTPFMTDEDEVEYITTTNDITELYATIAVNKLNASIEFSNVWNRHELYFHSDFAGISEHCLIARDGDFYQHPIKYPYSKSASLFKLWVSFDGKNPAKLLYPDFIVELDFVANADDNYDD